MSNIDSVTLCSVEARLMPPMPTAPQLVSFSESFVIRRLLNARWRYSPDDTAPWLVDTAGNTTTLPVSILQVI